MKRNCRSAGGGQTGASSGWATCAFVLTKWFLRSASHRHDLLYERSTLLPFSHGGFDFELGTRGRICTCNLRLLRPAPLLVGLRGRSLKLGCVRIRPGNWYPRQELHPHLDTLSTCCLYCWATWVLSFHLKWHFRLDSNQQPCASKAPALPIELRKRSLNSGKMEPGGGLPQREAHASLRSDSADPAEPDNCTGRPFSPTGHLCLLWIKNGTRWRTASARTARKSAKRFRRSGEAG